MVPFPHFTAETFEDLLDEALRDARDDGAEGVLLTILPERRLRVLGPASHAASEDALGRKVRDEMRVVCLYTSKANVEAGPFAKGLPDAHTRVFRTVKDQED